MSRKRPILIPLILLCVSMSHGQEAVTREDASTGEETASTEAVSVPEATAPAGEPAAGDAAASTATTAEVETAVSTEPVATEEKAATTEPAATETTEAASPEAGLPAEAPAAAGKDSSISGIAGLEVFLSPGMTCYADAVGFNIQAGAQIPFRKLFKAPQLWLDNIVVGGAFLFDGVSSPLAIDTLGLDLRVGYRFLLTDYLGSLPPALQELRITALLINGIYYQGVARSGRDVTQGAAYHLSPELSVDMPMPFNKSLRAGLEMGYHIFAGGTTTESMHVGLFASWTF
jgi:hypothetical protein